MVPGQELLDPALPVAVDERLEDAGQIGVWLDAVELRRLDQRGDDPPVLGALVVTGEECVLAVEGDWADRPLDGVAVDLDAPVLEEQGEAVPELGDVAQRLAERGFGGDAGAVVLDPVAEGVDEPLRALPPGRTSAASPSWPLRKSTGLVATKIRTRFEGKITTPLAAPVRSRQSGPQACRAAAAR